MGVQQWLKQKTNKSKHKKQPNKQINFFEILDISAKSIPIFPKLLGKILWVSLDY